MKINATGFVSAEAGSVASANAILLERLLALDHHIAFFTKPSFVDPRAAVTSQSSKEKLRIVDCTNHLADGTRRRVSPTGRGIWGRAWSSIDANSYNRGLVRAMRRATSGDVDLWLGDWAHGRGDRPVVSFVQGPPGTDARSIERHRDMIERLAGKLTWLKLAAYARWRLSAGLPTFSYSDDIIVGSQWSRRHLIEQYQLSADHLHAVPYPVDLQTFQPTSERRPRHQPLRLFWLGRFVPRKRLDLFLDGLALAIGNGYDVEAWVVGKSGFVPGYERLLEQFPYPERLRCWASVPRAEVPGLLAQVDVIAQPSDDENFGSSVAEALACGVPAIVGATNGTGDYVCERSVRLRDADPQTFAAAIEHFVELKRNGELADPSISRLAAEKWFDATRVVQKLESILGNAIAGRISKQCQAQ